MQVVIATNENKRTTISTMSSYKKLLYLTTLFSTKCLFFGGFTHEIYKRSNENNEYKIHHANEIAIWQE